MRLKVATPQPSATPPLRHPAASPSAALPCPTLSTQRLVLHLKGKAKAAEGSKEGEAAGEAEPRVHWTDDTVDNEHLGKKSSKCT